MNRIVKLTTSISKWSTLMKLPSIVDLVEVRSDILGDTIPDNHTNKPLVYVLKSIEERGTFTGTKEERINRLIEATTTFDFIELEGERDLIPEILDYIPAERRRIAWYDIYKNYHTLKSQIVQYSQTEASLYKMVVNTKNLEETVAVTSLIKSFKTLSVLAYSIGEFSKIFIFLFKHSLAKP